MSSIIEQVEVTGFWGNHDIKVTFDPHINFLIGPNGSGKTTFIELIAAALSADFYTLSHIDFGSITIKLKRLTPYSKPIVKVTKSCEINDDNEEIEYSIYSKSSSKPFVFSPSRSIPPKYRHDPKFFARMKNRFQSPFDDLESDLSDFCNLSWLAVHRATLQDDEQRSTHDLVDRKLYNVEKDLSLYFGQLQQSAAEEVKGFQKRIFLSLLSRETDEMLIEGLVQLKIEEEKNSLAEAFAELGVEERRFKSKMESHFSRFKRSRDKLNKNDSVTLQDILALVNTWGIHYVVSEWHRLAEKRDEIFGPREAFLEILNEFYKRKRIVIDKSHRLSVITQSGKELHAKALSSGEKQLLILLSEALLQKQNQSVYIADEPELSLHIEWQDKLVSSLRALNSNAQIIFATHSPDIVGPFGENGISMESIIS